MLALFISPHSKKIGETYIFPKMLEENQSCSEISFALYNVSGEWDHLSGDYFVINNPLMFLPKLSPNIESISPWWNYRIWLMFVSLSIFMSLPLVLIRLAKSHKKIFVVARMATSSVGLVGFFFNNKKKYKFIASMAGVPLVSALRKISWPVLYRNFDAIVCPCETMISHVANLTDLKKEIFVVIPNAVLDESSLVTAHAKFKKRQFFRDENYTWRLLSVGRLTKQKGVDTLISAMSYVRNSVELNIIGEGEDLGKLKNLVKSAGLSDTIRFLGYKSHPFQFSDDFDIFIMPSRWEGPGHTIIEALAAGLPSIVSNCPFGPEEAVGFGQFGHVFQVDDIRGLSKLIDNVIDNYSENKSSLRLGLESLEQYEPKNVVNTWVNFLKNV